jgi:hypothetical protein
LATTLTTRLLYGQFEEGSDYYYIVNFFSDDGLWASKAISLAELPVMSRSDNQDPFLAHTHFVTGEIPSSLGKLEKLEGLFLNGNQLSGKVNISGTSPVMSRVQCV